MRIVILWSLCLALFVPASSFAQPEGGEEAAEVSESEEASPSAPVQSPPVARQLSPGSRAPPSPLPESSVHEGGHDPWTMHAGERRYSRGQGFPTDGSPRTTPLQVRYGVPSAEAILEYGDGSSCE